MQSTSTRTSTRTSTSTDALSTRTSTSTAALSTRTRTSTSTAALSTRTSTSTSTAALSTSTSTSTAALSTRTRTSTAALSTRTRTGTRYSQNRTLDQTANAVGSNDSDFRAAGQLGRYPWFLTLPSGAAPPEAIRSIGVRPDGGGYSRALSRAHPWCLPDHLHAPCPPGDAPRRTEST